uniref:SexP n=1 Tax=Mucor irregularis TaxID=713888 RepID=A0A1S6Q8Q8_9FUNG|nr:sexP [Mucor irregularis]AQV12072.1 sexP [Mucor irregularis]
MKTRTAIKLKQRPLVRKLEPKTEKHIYISVKELSFSNNLNGTTIVKIYPSEVTLTSRSLIEMIEAKKESIALSDNTSVLRDDILYAIHNFSCDGSQADHPPKEDNSLCLVKSDRPKRPTNAFMLYRIALRRKIKTLFPSFNNSDISRFIGAMWKAASDDIKEKYIEQANQYRILHKKAYPDFEYNVKKESLETSNSSSYNNIVSPENWDSYFDWCLQMTTSEAISNNFGPIENTQSFIPQLSQNISDTKFELHNFMELSPADELYYQDWNDLCNIVSEFFPDQNSFIDDKLWTSLNKVDIINNTSQAPQQ